jgi:high-affinity nickel-transport protein
MAGEVSFGLISIGVGLGLRHGIDWDHIAAITDVTSAQPTRWRGIAMGTLYAVGHGLVVVTLGLLAIWAATLLPEGLDSIMERVVGATLLFLAAWVFWSLIRHPGEFALRSRWMLVFAGVSSAYRWARSKLTGQPHVAATTPRTYGVFLTLVIGMIHGIGAETGSQVLLFASAAGAGTAIAGTVLLIAFVAGLLVSNSLITVGSTLGILGARARRVTYLVVGVIVGLFSLVMGVYFLVGKSGVLPPFFS